MERILIAGAGYTGARLARLLLSRGTIPLAFVRSAASASQLEDFGARVCRADLDREDPPRETGVFAAGAAVCYLIPPPPDGEDDPRLVRFLASLPDGPRGGVRRLVYASTTGVYGDCGGALVDEQRAPAPGSARSLRRVAAERAATEWCERADVELVILRLPAIYGPGRLPTAKLAQGDMFPAPAHAHPGNRIHVDDLVNACDLALGRQAPPGLYNLGDGNHESYTAFAARVAAQAGLPAPLTSPGAPGGRDPFRESRRVDNRKMREVLGLKLRYANPEDGIRASLR